MMLSLLFAAAASYPLAGPATICGQHLRIALEADEVLEAVASGIHALSLSILGPTGHVQIAEADIFKDRQTGRRVPGTGFAGDVRLERDDHGRPQYRLRAAPNDARISWTVAIVNGEGLHGNRRDHPLLARIAAEDMPTGCTRTYRYGLDVMLAQPDGREPSSQSQ